MGAKGDRREEGTGLRRRKMASKGTAAQFDSVENEQDGKPQLPSRLSSPSSVAGFFMIVLCLGISVMGMLVSSWLMKHNLQSRYEAEPTLQQPFVSENAMQHIRKIAAKPRWIGSLALEESLEYVHAELLALKPIAERNGLALEVEFFRSGPGSYVITLSDIELIMAYSNASSVIARLRPAHFPVDTKEDALLINAHIDSAVGAPGASDNVVGVGVGMEVARCIASSPVYELKRPIVFLFNGAEEAMCVGAHSFVKQHRWATPIAAHINLESLGPGDSYTLFRLGPHNFWLAEVYASSVSLPSTSVTASDLFDSQVIPAETDFRIFKEHGGIPGFDFVLLDNGYVYHTIHDSIENVDPLGVKHGGVIIMELALALAGPTDAIGARDKVITPSSAFDRMYAAMIKLSIAAGLVSDPEHPRAVFFDILQFKTMVYEEGAAAIFNVIVLFITLVVWLVKLMVMSADERIGSFRMVAIPPACLLASLASSTFASLVYVQVYGAKLRWYGSSLLACLMFAPPAVFGSVSAMLLLLPKRLSSNRFDQMLFASTVFHFGLAVVFMSAGFMSSYLPILMLVVDILCAFQRKSVPVLRHITAAAAHAILGSRVYTTALFAVLPLMGRVAIDVVPHDTIAALIVTFLTFISILQPALPVFCYYVRSLKKLQLLSFFISVGVAAWLVAITTLVGQGHTSGLRVFNTKAPKRIIPFHFYSPQQQPESVLGIGSQDYIRTDVDRIVSTVLDIEDRQHPATEFYEWGVLNSTAIETYRPFRAFLQDVAIFKVNERPALPLPEAKVLAEEQLAEGWNVTFLIEAPDSHQLTVRFPTGENSSVLNWSLEVPLTDRPHGAWIRYVGSFEYVFWVVLRKGIDPSTRPRFTMAITSGRLGTSRSPRHLSKLVVEDWESASMLVTTGIEVEL